MSKKISGALALLTLFCLCAGSFLTRGHAQTGAAGTAQNAAIVSTTAAVLKETSELRELAVLKTVGFRDWAVVALLACESLVLCLAAAALGMGVAEGLLWIASGRIPLDVGLALNAAVVRMGTVLAVGLALFSSLLPARRSLKLQIAEALADK